MSTTTVPASGNVQGTVIIQTPPGYATITTLYPGSITTTTTVPPAGLIQGTVIIQTPGVYTTVTTVYTGPGTIAAPTTVTTISASGVVPGTVIVQTPGSFTTQTTIYAGSITTTTTVPPSGNVAGTVIVQTPPGYATITILYTGSSQIAGPITGTIPPVGTTQGTVVVQLPPSYTIVTTQYGGSVTLTSTITPTDTTPGTILVQVPTPYVTVTSLYTGPVQLAGPSTTTISAAAGGTGTVVVATPPVTVTVTTLYTTGTTTLTSTILPTGTAAPATATILIQTPAYFGCDHILYGRVGNGAGLRVSSTGVETQLFTNLGDGRPINALGYNRGDNYLYGVLQTGTGNAAIMRIGSDGSYAIGPTLATSLLGLVNYQLQSGDIDEQYQYWISAGGAVWFKIDMSIGSSNYGTVVLGGGGLTGTSVTNLLVPEPIADWAWTPSGGNYLYSVARDTNSGATTVLLQFNRLTTLWSVKATFSQIIGSQGTEFFGAVWPNTDGYLYAQDNISGDIWKFPVNATGTVSSALRLTGGLAMANSDGARCT
ncbi:hypothetical protein GQ53DRAFT_758089 [Thozetella sp. PMI_491]|nr:hypothetical protein GQ53DRAFT_758089 [Thozetella sp. PMI_491]